MSLPVKPGIFVVEFTGEPVSFVLPQLQMKPYFFKEQHSHLSKL